MAKKNSGTRRCKHRLLGRQCRGYALKDSNPLRCYMHSADKVVEREWTKARMRGGLSKKIRDINWTVGQYDVGSIEGLRKPLVDVLKSLVMNPNSVNRARALVGVVREFNQLLQTGELQDRLEDIEDHLLHKNGCSEMTFGRARINRIFRKSRQNAALAEIPEARELYETNVSPVKYTKDQKAYLQKRVQWFPEAVAGEPDIMLDGASLEEEAGLEKARSLRGWHGESRTYLIQVHPDDPRKVVHDLADDDITSRSGKNLMSGSHSVAGGVVFTRRPTMMPEEWQQERWRGQCKALAEHFE